MQRVWNITDGSHFDGPARILMIMGKSIEPGRSVAIPDSRVKRAHKLAIEVESGAIYVGDEPPAWYRREKDELHFPFPIGHHRAHGNPKAPVKPAKKEVMKVEEAKAELEISDMDSTVEDQETGEGFGRKRRHRG